MSVLKSPYRQLQARAKARGIPANQSGDILEALLDEATAGGAGDAGAGASPSPARPHADAGFAASQITFGTADAAAFRWFQLNYLAVYLLTAFSDWLQGTHM